MQEPDTFREADGSLKLCWGSHHLQAKVAGQFGGKDGQSSWWADVGGVNKQTECLSSLPTSSTSETVSLPLATLCSRS